MSIYDLRHPSNLTHGILNLTYLSDTPTRKIMANTKAFYNLFVLKTIKVILRKF